MLKLKLTRIVGMVLVLSIITGLVPVVGAEAPQQRSGGPFLEMQDDMIDA